VSYPGQARGRAVFTEAAGEPAGRPVWFRGLERRRPPPGIPPMRSRLC